MVVIIMISVLIKINVLAIVVQPQSSAEPHQLHFSFFEGMAVLTSSHSSQTESCSVAQPADCGVNSYQTFSL